MNWGDIYMNEKSMDAWEQVCAVLGIILFVIFIVGIIVVGNAYEEHKLCMNGAIEHCIPEDFQ